MNESVRAALPLKPAEIKIGERCKRITHEAAHDWEQAMAELTEEA